MSQLICIFLTLYLLVSFADYLCKQFGPRSESKIGVESTCSSCIGERIPTFFQQNKIQDFEADIQPQNNELGRLCFSSDCLNLKF